jgi:hypothetical protein
MSSDAERAHTGEMTRTHPVRSTLIAVLTTGVIGTATVALDAMTAKDAGPAPAPVVHAPVLELVPAPLNCLLTTGFALSCLGVPQSRGGSVPMLVDIEYP